MAGLAAIALAVRWVRNGYETYAVRAAPASLCQKSLRPGGAAQSLLCQRELSSGAYAAVPCRRLSSTARMMARAKAKAAAAAEEKMRNDPALRAKMEEAEKKAEEMKAKAVAKAKALDEKHGVSAAAEAKAEQAKAKASEMEKAAMIKAHGKVAELFYEYDADDSGWLDEEEVLSFCGSL